MKHMIRSLVLLSALFAMPVVYGAAPPAPQGVAGVDVVVKQKPSKRAVTDARGNFAFDALSPGSYILAFRAREAKDLSRTPERHNPKVSTDKVTVASSYSIKIEGTKLAVNRSGLTGDKLTGGVEIAVEVGSGGKVRGQVLAAQTKKMVWISQQTGSHMPGHWVEADSAEAKEHKLTVHSADDLQNLKWNANMVDEKDPRNGPNAPDRGPRS
jgi:hypothetical protein